MLDSMEEQRKSIENLKKENQKLREVRSHLTQSLFNPILQKSILTKIRQLILYISKSKGYVDGFVGELTF